MKKIVDQGTCSDVPVCYEPWVCQLVFLLLDSKTFFILPFFKTGAEIAFFVYLKHFAFFPNVFIRMKLLKIVLH